MKESTDNVYVPSGDGKMLSEALEDQGQSPQGQIELRERLLAFLAGCSVHKEESRPKAVRGDVYLKIPLYFDEASFPRTDDPENKKKFVSQIVSVLSFANDPDQLLETACRILEQDILAIEDDLYRDGMLVSDTDGDSRIRQEELPFHYDGSDE